MVLPGRTYNAGSYRYGFNGKEKDGDMDGNNYDYGFRIYNPGLGRFLSVDPLTAKFTWLTPYQFAANTPLQAVDLDGKEAFFIHGTTSEPSRWYIPDDGTNQKDYTLMKGLLSLTNSSYVDVSFSWHKEITVKTGGSNPDGSDQTEKHYTDRLTNNVLDREIAAKQLVDHVMHYRKEKGIDKYDNEGNIIEYGKEQITFVTHSHGGNVSIQAAKMIYKKYGLKTDLITIETPAYNDVNGKENPDDPSIRKHIHISNNSDGVQGGLAGSDTYTNKKTINIRLNVSKFYSKLHWQAAHSFDNEHMKAFINMLFKFHNATLKDKKTK